MTLDELTAAAKRWKDDRDRSANAGVPGELAERPSEYYDGLGGCDYGQLCADRNALADYAAEVLTGMAEVFGEPG